MSDLRIWLSEQDSDFIDSIYETEKYDLYLTMINDIVFYRTPYQKVMENNNIRDYDSRRFLRRIEQVYSKDVYDQIDEDFPQTERDQPPPSEDVFFDIIVGAVDSSRSYKKSDILCYYLEVIYAPDDFDSDTFFDGVSEYGHLNEYLKMTA